jgi:hypothetical protein
MLVSENSPNIQGIETLIGVPLLVAFIDRNRLFFVAGGATLVGIGSSARFEGSFAQQALVGIGGVALGLGILPFIFDALK